MTDLPTVLLPCAVVITGAMLLSWLLSLATRDAGIVDIFWGLGFVLTAWVTFVIADGVGARRWMLAVLTTVWGV